MKTISRGLLDWHNFPSTMQELAAKWEDCKKCKMLVEGRRHVVMGDPHPDTLHAPYPRVMAVGQAPGKDEDKTGIPFQGRPGQICRQQLADIGIPASDIYWTNVLACKPPDGEYGPMWRAAWVQNCWNLLEASVSIMRPKLIVAMGRNAAQRLGVRGNIGDTRRTQLIYKTATVIVTGFPGQILRASNKKQEKEIAGQLEVDYELVKKLYQELVLGEKDDHSNTDQKYEDTSSPW